MWQKLETWYARRCLSDDGRGTVLVDADDPRTSVPVVMQRWEGADGRFVMHVSDAHPCLLVLEPGVILRADDREQWLLHEFDLPRGQGEPNPADPIAGVQLVRTVAPEAPADGDRWALLRGWS